MSVLHPEALRDDAERNEAEPLIQVQGVDVGGDDGVELHDLKAVRLALR